MAGSSTSNSSGYSNSKPTVIQTPQSEWALQLSQLLGAMTQNQYGWAMDQFNNGMGITDQNINNYMKLAGMGAGLAQNLLGRYTQVFEPLMDKYIQQAGSYNSADRQKFMMGQAESTAAQADKSAMDSAQRQLQSYGINPNSGRYQDLMLSSRMQDAATRAGAGTQASVNTAAIGRQMTEKAAQMGQNIPGMTVNALQSAYTGVTGAENAILGMLNTGANLTNSAANFGNAAANANKMPPVGQISTSQNHGQSNSQQQDPSKGNPDKNNQQQQRQPAGQGQGNGTGSGMNGRGANANDGARPYASWGDPNWKAPQGNSDGQGDDQNIYNDPSQMGPQMPSDFGGMNFGDFNQQPGGDGPFADPNAPGSGASGMGPWQDPNDNGSSWQQTDPWGGQNDQMFQQDQQGQYGGQGGDYSNGQYQPQQQADYSGGQGNYGGSSQGTYGGQGGDYSQSYQPQQQSDYSNGQGDYGGYSRGGAVRGCADGGVIPNRTSGGFVPKSASPSRGRQTDDIPARLNAKEFVIPRDVTEHYGTKHFQDLIAKSRKLRTGMAGPPARPKMKPALQQRPTFQSHYMSQ